MNFSGEEEKEDEPRITRMGTDIREEHEIQNFLIRVIRVIRAKNPSGPLVPLQKAVHFFRQLLAYSFSRCNVFDARFAQALHGTKSAQQKIFSVLTHSRTIVEHALDRKSTRLNSSHIPL